MPHGATCVLDWIASWPIDEQEAFLDALPPHELAGAAYLFEMTARPLHQLPPGGDWRVWVALGGRGSGKTRAGAEWTRAQVEGSTPLAPGRRRRMALVAETADQARDVMVLGESGLLAVSPPDRRPDYHVSRRRLVWPNGAEAHLFSAKDPESLRGPQFDGAWCDELAKWRRGRAAWDMLQFGLRLGDDPRAVVTTTPRRGALLEALLADPATVTTSAPTDANIAHLAPSFLAHIRSRYDGSALGRQEIDGHLLTEAPGAFWTRAMLEAARVPAAPALDRIVVAVDPPTTSRRTSDACGVVVAGAVLSGAAQDWRAYVLEDASVQGLSPAGWAARAVAAFHAHGADRLVAEVNQGGEMVETIIRQIDPNVPFRAVHATRGKAARAEPVAALYEQGRVRHVARLDALEDQLTRFAPGQYTGGRSPDRLDALVWAITDLLLTPGPGVPRVRGL